MSTRFSIPGAPLISNIGPSTIRTSRVLGTQVVGAPISGGIASTYGAGYRGTYGGPVTGLPAVGGLRTSTVITTGGVPTPGVRGSMAISPDQIPAGTEMIRVERPPEYIYHNATPHAETVTKTVVNDQVNVPPPPRRI